MKNKKITKDEILKMSYPDFVGFINQWNVLPGAYTTLSKWITYSRLNKNSKLLEVACTTGFSSRELSLLSECEGEAFDFSSKSIEMANYNKNEYAKNSKINYFVQDGYKYKTKNKFTHIVVGASLKFFSNPSKILDICVKSLVDNGYILASPFYVTENIPANLIKKAEKIFGVKPTNNKYKDIMNLYKGLEVIYEDRSTIIKETEEELHHYCKSTIDRAAKIIKSNDNDVYDAMYNRLYDIKKMSNDLRPYQMYSVLVLRYRKKIYPNRFVELF